MSRYILENATANGDSEIVAIGPEGLATLDIGGVFDSCTVTLYAKGPLAAVWKAVTDGAKTAADVVNIEGHPDTQLKATISDAGASTSITVEKL